MKKYKITAQSLIGQDAKNEYIIDAENEETAKEIAINHVLAEENDGMLLDSPTQLFIAEEVGYFYGHKSEPHNITELVDNLGIYIDEMRETEDAETIPKYLKQYIWEYFREVEFSKTDLKKSAIFFVDNIYRKIVNLKLVDKYTKAYFALVISHLWAAFQDRGVDVFYVVDNTFNDENKFRAAVELFRSSGMGVVTPYRAKKAKDFADVSKEIRDFMSPIRMIMYIEKDSSVNYLDKVLEIAKASKYLCIFRNKASKDAEVEVFD